MAVRRDWLLNQVTVAGEGAQAAPRLVVPHLRLAEGSIYLLAGRVGAGKTTLLEGMAGLQTLAAGEITYAGLSLWSDKAGKQGKAGKRGKRLHPDVLPVFGIAWQESAAQWFCRTVEEELAYSLKPYLKRQNEPGQDANLRYVQALEAVGLSADMLARDPWSLSGGEQRRLSLACLLVTGARWLFLDEPTAGLDAAGVKQMTHLLTAHKAAGGGAVVASHDVPQLAAAADTVIRLEGGQLLGSFLARDRRGRPPTEGEQTAERIAMLGIPLPQGAENDPGVMAGAILDWLELEKLEEQKKQKKLEDRQKQEDRKEQKEQKEQEEQEKFVTTAASGAAEAGKSSGMGVAATLAAADPRALWLGYLLLSAGILAQRHWLGLAVAALLAGSLLVPLRAILKPWAGAIRYYLLFIGLFTLFAGLSLLPLRIDLAAVEQTAFIMGRLLLVMLLGLVLPGLMTPYRLQQAIEQLLQPLARLRVPVGRIALTTGLMLRFVPLLAREWQRFAKLALARGKTTAPAGTIPWRQVHMVLLPYLLAMLRLAEDIAAALEMRGFDLVADRYATAYRLRWSWRDTGLSVLALFALIGLLALAAGATF